MGEENRLLQISLGSNIFSASMPIYGLGERKKIGNRDNYHASLVLQIYSFPLDISMKSDHVECEKLQYLPHFSQS